jgi:hypothetical protein
MNTIEPDSFVGGIFQFKFLQQNTLKQDLFIKKKLTIVANETNSSVAFVLLLNGKTDWLLIDSLYHFRTISSAVWRKNNDD